MSPTARCLQQASISVVAFNPFLLVLHVVFVLFDWRTAAVTLFLSTKHDWKQFLQAVPTLPCGTVAKSCRTHKLHSSSLRRCVALGQMLVFVMFYPISGSRFAGSHLCCESHSKNGNLMQRASCKRLSLVSLSLSLSGIPTRDQIQNMTCNIMQPKCGRPMTLENDGSSIPSLDACNLG